MESQDGISVRPMRRKWQTAEENAHSTTGKRADSCNRLIVKVLYTFDDASKTNCLARWPSLLEIQTAHLDEKTQIGVIELKTCIKAIVSARFAFPVISVNVVYANTCSCKP